MALKLLFFAQSSDWMRRHEMELPVKGPVVLAALIKSRPELAPILKRQSLLKVAVNEEFADLSCEVKDGDEVAFLPPVSGG